MVAIAEAKSHLERTYDIPFDIKESIENHELCYYIGPASKEQELFSIRVAYRNNIRLIMELIPGKYSAHFISEMGEQTDEKKSLFVEYKTVLEKKGALCEIMVNNETLDYTKVSTWPKEWKRLSIRTTRLNAFEGIDMPNNLLALAEEWYTLMVGMILALTDIVPLENEEIGYKEGKKEEQLSIRYERNPLNRKLCLEEKGYNCTACGFNFSEYYGELGQNFIHVHHIIPVSQLGENYIINPRTDLVPVCPNCHAMLHRVNPPISVEALVEIIKNNKD